MQNYQGLTDETLMARYVGGDRSAFQELFARYYPLVFGMARQRLPCSEAARDVAQQTFLNLHRARFDFRAGRRLRPWLVTIGMNLIREHHRYRSRRRECELLEDPRAVEPVGERELQRQQEAARVRQALQALPSEQRRVIEMHWLEERPFSEVAAALGQRLSTVKVRAHRGYKRLRAALATTPSAVGAT